MTDAWLWAIVGVLLCVTVAETAIIAELVRQTERILRTAFPPYRADADADKAKPGHYSMYKTKGVDDKA